MGWLFTGRRSGGKRQRSLLARFCTGERLEERRLLSISAESQLFAHLLNEVRHDPVGYAARTGLLADLSDVLPSPPLAVNDSLFGSSQFHSQDMADNDFLGHASSQTGDMPNKVARDHGYPLPVDWLDAANNIQVIAAADFLSTSETTLEEFIEDVDHPGGEVRDFLLSRGGWSALGKEIGVGHGYNEATERAHFWTVEIAYRDTRDRFVTGVVYADSNSNGRFDLDEGLPEVVVAAGSCSATTNAAGGYSIKVPDGDYLVSASGGGFQGTALGLVEVLGENVEVDFTSGQARPMVDFGAYQNRAPLAIDDSTTVAEDGAVSAEVLANDTDTDGTLAVGSITITQPPGHGTAQVEAATGSIRYAPDPSFTGFDYLAYTVRDDEGAVSNEATVSITVEPRPASPWRNPSKALDVNNDSLVTPLDALLVINVLNLRGSYGLPETPGTEPAPPPYLDPSGDYQVSALDALLIVNHLNAESSGEGEDAQRQAAEPPAFIVAREGSILENPACSAPRNSRRLAAAAAGFYSDLLTTRNRMSALLAVKAKLRVAAVVDELMALDLDWQGGLF